MSLTNSMRLRAGIYKPEKFIVEFAALFAEQSANPNTTISSLTDHNPVVGDLDAITNIQRMK